MILRILKYISITLGCLFFILFVLSLTSVPFRAWYGMGMKYSGIHRPPDVIVVLGGGGMPSESGLMRCWYAARAASHFTRAKVIIALPGNASDSLSSINSMKDELILRGIKADRILLEDSGTNTRAEALNIRKIVTGNLSAGRKAGLPITPDLPPSLYGSRPGGEVAVLIITSPEHLYRSVLCFRKVGFTRVDGLPAFEATIESDITFDDQMLGGRKWMPSIGKNLTLRYQFWTQLHYEQLVMREWLAVVYYKLKGWI
jgi:uncharacterized SAM-binding protein YcdF (DUF218 family)